MEIEKRDFESFDGTKIAYQATGKGFPIIFANGLGGTSLVWRRLADRLDERCRVICWDYRGLWRCRRTSNEYGEAENQPGEQSGSLHEPPVYDLMRMRRAPKHTNRRRYRDMT